MKFAAVLIYFAAALVAAMLVTFYVLKTTMYDQCRVNHGAMYCAGLLIK